MNFKQSFNKIKLSTKKHSPEILMIGGIIGMVSAAVLACKETIKVKSIIDEKNEIMKQIRHAAKQLENGESPETVDGSAYTVEDVKKDTTIVYTRMSLNLAKLYAPSVILGTLSITSILTSNNILKKRNLALSAAYAALDKGFKEYRNRVIERFGEKVDRQIRYNLKEETVEEEIIDENGKKKKVKKTIEVPVSDGYSMYAKVFDELNPNYQKDSTFNMCFITNTEKFLNQRLVAKGYMFLNEVYEALGFEPTRAGQVIGWVYDPDNKDIDSYISFKIFDIYNQDPRINERKKAFINGYERSIILDFNPDGNILDYMPENSK